jgi:Domain of unknown function (DUF397)
MTSSGQAGAHRRTQRRVRWRTSTYSNASGNCVEVAAKAGTGAEVVAVRDSKDPQGPQLRFRVAQWKAFLRGVKEGRFDPGTPG